MEGVVLLCGTKKSGPTYMSMIVVPWLDLAYDLGRYLSTIDYPETVSSQFLVINFEARVVEAETSKVGSGIWIVNKIPLLKVCLMMKSIHGGEQYERFPLEIIRIKCSLFK